MYLELNPQGLCLRQNQLLKVRGGIGHAIVCYGGSLWLTQHHDQRDIVLSAGESFAPDRNGLALVQALKQSAVSIAPRSSHLLLVNRTTDGTDAKPRSTEIQVV